MAINNTIFSATTPHRLQYLHRSPLSYARHRCSSYLPVLWDENELGHDEFCLSRNRWITRRHDNPTPSPHWRRLSSTLSRDRGHSKGNDGTTFECGVGGTSGSRTLDYDETIYSLYTPTPANAHAAQSTTRAPLDASEAKHALAQCLRYLTKIGKVRRTGRPTISGELRPLVLSPRGLVPKESADELVGCNKELDEAFHDRMMTRSVWSC